MPKLVLVKPCPDPSRVRGAHCDVCDMHVHDLTRSFDPASDVARIGAGAKMCARVLATAVVLGGCSGAVDGSAMPIVLTPTVSTTPDAGTDAIVPPDDPSTFVGEMDIVE